MNKDSKARPGRSSCDFCNEPATGYDGKFVVCAKHAKREGEKRASAELSLKAASLTMVDKHR